MSVRFKIGVIASGILLFANILIWQAVFAESRGGILTVAFLDVGQGDAIFIEAPNGNQVLIDGGPNAKVLRELGAVMPFYDRFIDAVIVTHPDKDHISGVIDVFSRYDVGTVLEAGVESDTDLDDALRALAQERGVERITARGGTVLDLGGGALLEILFPDRDVSGLDPNDASVMAKLSYGETSFLLTGDASKKIEEYLVALYGGALDADVLKLGHHGSDTSTSRIFLAAVSPAYAIVSAGEGNRYGHPHSEVLDLLAEFDIAMLSTAEARTIVFESDGREVQMR